MTSTNSQELQTTVRNQAILIQKLQEQLRGANAQIKVLKEMNRRTHPKKYGLPTLDKSTPRAYEDPFWKKGGGKGKQSNGKHYQVLSEVHNQNSGVKEGVGHA